MTAASSPATASSPRLTTASTGLLVSMKKGRSCSRSSLVKAGAVEGRTVGEQAECAFSRAATWPFEGTVLLGGLTPALELRLGARQVGQHELELEDRRGLQRGRSPRHVGVFEGPKHQADRIRFADPAEEPVAKPSPVDDPATRPAMSTSSTPACTTFCEELISARASRRWSGTCATPDARLGRRERVAGDQVPSRLSER